MDWFTLSADASLGGLFAASLLGATLLPGGSEAVLFALLRAYPEQWWSAVLLATLGNTLGGMVSWACGRWLPKWQRLEALPQLERVRSWGAPVLLLAWAPLVGDALCVAAGWLRLHWLPCVVFMAVGKGARYWVVAQGTLL